MVKLLDFMGILNLLVGIPVTPAKFEWPLIRLCLIGSFIDPQIKGMFKIHFKANHLIWSRRDSDGEVVHARYNPCRVISQLKLSPLLRQGASITGNEICCPLDMEHMTEKVLKEKQKGKKLLVHEYVHSVKSTICQPEKFHEWFAPDLASHLYLVPKLLWLVTLQEDESADNLPKHHKPPVSSRLESCKTSLSVKYL